MKYHVKNEHGELVVPSYRELRSLYKAQFIGDEDQVRKEDSERWVRAGNMRDLKVLKPKPWHGNEFAYLSAAICVLTLLMIFLIKR